MPAVPRLAPPPEPALMYGPGDIIDIWVVEAALGRGGMGSVYRCHNRAATRILAAVKVLDGTLKRYPEAEARFVREADILAQIDHPNIVKVRNVRPDADPPYIEMEFAAGESLDERLRRGPIEYPVAVALMRQCADAIAYLHQLGIYHRDIKPANLIVDRNRAKLVDFGLAVESDSSRITQQGVAFGTVSYAPPEWITPERLDPRKWDVYALGVVFWELLTGQPAFPVSGHGNARQQAMQVMVAKQGHDPLDPGDAFHDDVRSLIAAMTHPDPAARLCEADQVALRAAELEPSLRRSAGVTLAPSLGSSLNPFADTEPPSQITAGESPVPRRLELPAALSTAPVTTPPSRFAAFAVAAGMALGAAALALGAAASAAVAAAWLAAPNGWWEVAAPPSPPLVVEVAPPSFLTAAQIDVQVDGAELAADRGAARTFAWPDGQRGPEATVRWAAGDGCTVAGCAAGTCPAWCVTGEAAVAGAVEVHPLRPTVEPREAEVAVAGIPPGMPLVATLGDAVGARDGETLRFEVPPGRWPLRVAAGGCAETEGVLGGPVREEPGCTVAHAEVVVPAAGPAEPARVAIAVTAEPRRATASEARAPRVPRVVTNADLARFLAEHPDFRPGGQYGKADGYLVGWSPDGSPPDGARHRPPVGITPALAMAYCDWRGGRVLGLDDPPQDFDYLELRLDARRHPVYVQLDRGRRIPPAPLNTLQVVREMHFRCTGG